MTEGADFDFQEAFLAANANPEFMSGQLADLIRNILRAVSSDSGSIYKISEQMDFLQSLVARADQSVNWWSLFHAAIGQIRDSLPARDYDRDYVRIAERGIKYFVESSATDNAAAGRASRRLDEFETAIRYSKLGKDWQ